MLQRKSFNDRVNVFSEQGLSFGVGPVILNIWTFVFVDHIYVFHLINLDFCKQFSQTNLYTEGGGTQILARMPITGY